MTNLSQRIFYFLSVFLLLCFQVATVGQRQPYSTEFQPPLDIPLILAGNYGEIRSNHFHAGLDFKTNARIGYRVFSIDDGYISRIKTEPGGYGKAVYINHPSGYVSVYAHLDRFRDDIEKFVKKNQYEKEQFGIDLYLAPETFRLKKGEFFAFSGNSGSSQAPHLHFELRDSQTQNPLNPLLYNFSVADQIPPVLKAVYLYGLSGRKDLKKPIEVVLKGGNGIYSPATDRIYPLDDIAGIGIEAVDFLDAANNPCGVNEIEVFLGDELQSRIVINEISFAESRFINSFVDYERFRKNSQHVLKTFVEPNNHLSIYEYIKNKGRILVDDNNNHELLIKVRDVHGNESTVRMTVKRQPDAYNQYDYSKAVYSAYLNYAETNRFESDGLELILNPNTLYEDLYFQYDTEDSPKNYYSRIHHIHHQYTPLHRSITIKIRPDNLPAKLRNKALIASVNNRGGYSGLGGSWDGDFIKTTSSSFGSFLVAVDTIPPSVIPRNLSNLEPAAVGGEIRFGIRDDFSGISSFRGTVDGQWILFEYDAKSATLLHKTDSDYFPKGKVVELVMTVKDRVGNLSTFRRKVIRN